VRLLSIETRDEYGYPCERCGQVLPLASLDYCAHCSRNLCGKCMALGCCGFVPAKSGDAIDRDGEEDSL